MFTQRKKVAPAEKSRASEKKSHQTKKKSRQRKKGAPDKKKSRQWKKVPPKVRKDTSPLWNCTHACMALTGLREILITKRGSTKQNKHIQKYFAFRHDIGTL